ncbi:uncharacterized protein CC84DRAFT_1161255 [Paraphaeosphaeria sporulosa]|uniref:Uncharacterized protein n=1 Tax=Paraphaeosphaeria sporulosa TaxID=1460663 RepID=A0A177CTR3_9PLEO|nr:uncharacterized protein CC84DRAFT_1161255 [Paraphaeosphaeria sporulosa]OAG10290.1 hypothetical protein CC84DRAFT_1161255 [Paraphaeosphaeria sporulosa]
MCNGSSTRVSQGGSIAVLRPSREIREVSPVQQDSEVRLLFSNGSRTLLGSAGTHVELQGWDATNSIFQRRSWVVIHSDGDLSAAETRPAVPFFSFDIGSRESCTMELPETLNLGVGDTGIIGRRVSVMTGSTRGPLIVAEGIIGWN